MIVECEKSLYYRTFVSWYVQVQYSIFRMSSLLYLEVLFREKQVEKLVELLYYVIVYCNIRLTVLSPLLEECGW